jgi:AcrR family transcriptional regulator
MPRTISIDRERILDTAFELVRARGIDALSARALALQLDCSTQPLYREFDSMEQLRAAVEERAVQRGLDLFRDAQGTYLASGLGVLRMIEEDPHLFTLITRDRATIEAMVSRDPPHPAILAHMRGLPELEGLDEHQLRRVHTMMWFFAQGVAVLLELDRSERALALARSYGSLAGRALITWAKATRSDDERG